MNLIRAGFMLLTKGSPRICLAGHIGVGHVFSHSGFVQDDSLGFLTVVNFVKELFGLDIKLVGTSVDGDSIKVFTSYGGVGIGKPRRGLTPFEISALRKAGGDPLFVQRLALEIFGRFYGNGISESAVSFMYALSESILDSLNRAIPESKLLKCEDEISSDIVWGVNIDFWGVPLAILATVNGSKIGLGPCEDLEGNVYKGVKFRVLRSLRALKIPTIVVESKAFNPALSVDVPSFLVRYNEEVDNSAVALSLVDSLKELGYPFLFISKAFPLLSKPAIEVESKKFVSRLLRLVKAFYRVKTSKSKVLILGELAKLISEDAGGVSFMSSRVNKVARAVGLMPGTGAVISMCLPKGYIKEHKIPFVTEDDLAKMTQVVRKAVIRLWDRIEDAQRELNLKFKALGG
ncbi:MAG: hypothetical protein N3C62_01115 [Synergistetes bacterium]|nr:hypothetical protein [Synergistota bacterium]